MRRRPFLLSCAMTVGLGLVAIPSDALAACSAQGTWSGAFAGLGAGIPSPDFSGAADACVRIEPDVCVGFNETGPVYVDSLRVEGTLRFNDTGDRALNAHKIVVTDGGTFRVGTQSNRFTHLAEVQLADGLDCDSSGAGEYVIGDDGAGGLAVSFVANPTLTDFHPNEHGTVIPEPNRSLLVMAGATLQLHGIERATTWTHLTSTVSDGSTSFDVEAADDWFPGDEIVLTSTDFDPRWADRTWVDTVTPTAGSDTIEVVNYVSEHWSGQVGNSVAGLPDVNVAGEVALLSHNVKVWSPDSYASQNLYAECGNDVFFSDGAEIKISRGSGEAPLVEIENIEVFNAGKYDEMGHYPIHFHHGGDLLGSYVRGVSVHGSSNRAIVLHGTQRVELANNVVNEIVGHAYYLERSDVYDTKHNTLVDNIGMGVYDCNPLDIEIDSTGAAVFYFEDPRNSFVGNVAAGSEFAGFYDAQRSSLDSVETGISLDGWYMCGDDAVDYASALPGLPLDTAAFSYANVWYDDTKYEDWGYTGVGAPINCEGAFAHNTVHSTQNGFYANEHRDTFMRIVDLTAYKNAQRATMIKNKGATEMVGLMAADNGSAVWPASHAYHTWYTPSYLLVNSHIVGESANLGMTLFPNDDPTYDIYGVEVYEGRLHVADTHLEMFPPSAGARAVAAFGRHRAFPFYSNNVDNSVRNVSLDAGSQRLFFEEPYLRENGDAVAHASGYVSVMLQDLDGSLVPSGRRSTIVADHDFIVPGQLGSLPAYVTSPAGWNAHVIEPGDLRYGQILVRWCDTDEEIFCDAYTGGGVLPPSQAWTQRGGVFGFVAGMQIEDLTEGDLVTADHSPDGLHSLLGANVILGHEYAVDFWSDDAPVTLLDATAGDLDLIEAMEVQYRFAPTVEPVDLSIPVPAEPTEVYVIYGDDASATPLPSVDVSPLSPATNEEWQYEDTATERRVHLHLQSAAPRETVVVYMGFGDL